MEEKELDYRDKDVREAVTDFEQRLEEIQESGESQDCVILTNEHKIQGAVLALIDDLDLDHRIELDGRVYVTLE